MTFPLPVNWTDSTPAQGVHAAAHDDIAALLNKFAVGGDTGEVLAKKSGTDGDVGWAAGGGGGGAGAGALVTHKFPFTHATPNLLTGATAVFTDGYTPAVGDILHHFWLEVDTAWNGTTPRGELGEFLGGDTSGYFNGFGEGPVHMDSADHVPAVGQSNLLTENWAGVTNSNDSLMTWLSVQSPGPYPRGMPAKFVATHPLKMIVTQDGLLGGADPGSTQGAAIFYIVTSSP